MWTETETERGRERGRGGKLRKRPPFRRQETTPHDRPINNNNSNKSNWLTRHVVDPASKFISNVANRFFDCIRRTNRIPRPVSEVNCDVDAGFQQVVSTDLIVREPSQPINIPDRNVISDIEQLLTGNTFTRSEIDRLTELLHAKAAEASNVDESERKETQSGGLTVERRNKGIRFHGATSTSLLNPKALEDDIGSPAELAKAYMGSRPSKVSPSMLNMHGHGSRADTVLFGNTPINLPIVPFAKNSVRHGAVENGFITLRSLGILAIYSMARTPYSRGHSTSIVMGVGNNDNDFGQSVASSRSLSSHGEQLESKSTALKQISSYFDDEVGSSIGQIRRIRQKHNLLAPRVSHKLNESVNSSAKQKQPLIGEANDRLKGIVENQNGSVPSTSYASVPSRSREVASRILQHLDELTPKKKSSNKSPFELTPGMLHGQALRSMENVATSKFMQDLQDDHKMEVMSNVNLSDARESTSEKQEKVEGKGSKESVAPLGLLNSAKNESVVSLNDPGCSSAALESVVRNTPSQQPPQKRAFRMSALEDSFDQDCDLLDNGIAPTPLPEKKAPTETPLVESNLSTAEEPKLVKTTIQPEEVKSTSSFVLRKTSEFGFPSSGNNGDSSGALASSTPEESIKALQPAIAIDKPKDKPPPLFRFSSNVGNNFSPLPSESTGKTSEPKLDSPSSFITTPVPNGSPSKTPGTENSNLNTPKPADKIQKLDTATPGLNGPFASNPSTFSINTSSYGNLNPSKPADQTRKPDVATPTLNGPVISNPPTFSFNTSSSSDKNQIATTVDISTISAPLTSISNSTSSGIGTSTSPSFAGLFGSMAPSNSKKPSNSKEPILRFTAATYPSTPVSTASTTFTSEATDSKTNTNPIFGVSSNPTFQPFSSAISGTTIFRLASSATDSAPVTLQSSPFNNLPVTQSSSAQLASNTPSASFGANTSTPKGSSFSNSQPFNSNPTFLFGSSLASSSAINSNTPISGPAQNDTEFSSTTSTNTIGSSSAAPSSPFIFGGNSSSTPINTNGSESSSAATSPFVFGGSFSSASATAIGSSPAAPLSPFIFGGNSSSTSTNTIGSSPAAPSSPFIFGGNSSSTPINTNGSESSSAATSPFVFGGCFSSASATAIGSSPAAPLSPFIFGGNSSSTSTNTIGSSPAAPSSPFIFGGNSSSTPINTNGSESSSAATSPFIFGGSFSSASATAIGSSPAAPLSPFIFGGNSSSTSTNTIGSSPAATLSPFTFGGNSSASSAPMNSSSAPSNPFGSSVFAASSTPSSGFLFGGASSTPSAPTNTAPSIFSASTNISSSPVFPFSAQSASSLQGPSQPVFGSPNFGFGASPGNNNMNAEDSMAEDPVQSTSLFGQPSVSPSPPGFMFGQPPPAQVPFHFGGSDISGRRIVRPSKSRNRKK